MIDFTQLTADDFVAAGQLAEAAYDDDWFACDVAAETGEPTEPGTVIVTHNGIKYEVWLTRTWRAAQTLP